MMRASLSWPLGLVLLTLACTGGQTGDEDLLGQGGVGGSGAGTGGGIGPVAGEGGDATNTGSDDEEGTTCGVDFWYGPDQPVHTYLCERDTDEGPFTCDCDGQVTEADGMDGVSGWPEGSCSAALEEACEVDPDPITSFCIDVEDVASCWLNETKDVWRCRCVGSDELIEKQADGCIEAAYLTCATSCESERGACEPVPEADEEADEMAPGMGGVGGGFPGPTAAFRCDCDVGGEVVVPGVSCERALERCGPACAHDGGECFFVQLDGGGVEAFDCRCAEDARSDTVAWDELGDDGCQEALESICGADPSVERCEQQDDDASGSCRLNADSVTCSCSTSMGTHAGGMSVEDSVSCEDALRGFCPEAFE